MKIVPRGTLPYLYPPPYVTPSPHPHLKAPYTPNSFTYNFRKKNSGKNIGKMFFFSDMGWLYFLLLISKKIPEKIFVIFLRLFSYLSL